VRVSATRIETKLRLPTSRHAHVDRRRAMRLLERTASTRLVLVSAPPGFGKTTLIAAWARAQRAAGWIVAWVSLDPADDDPPRFWRYVVDGIAAAAGDATWDVTHETVITESGAVDMGALIEQLDRLPSSVAIVLDDLYVIETAAIHEELTALIDRAPDHVHLVVTTRADPPLPLARLRARGELIEVRAADLRFDDEEAEAFFREVMGLALSPDQVSALGARTEGWVAALQLAGLSLAGRADVASFIDRFAGTDRFVVDYLVDEVLGRQPAAIRRFLLETSILDRLSGPLCDAVTGGTDGRLVLDRLDRANLFLVPLDDERRWFRYHHLFADVLRARLLDEDPASVPELHRRASVSWETAGDLDEAVDHALAAQDEDRAADLIEVAAHALRQERRERRLRMWLDGLPDRIFEQRPMLAIVHVGALLATGETARVEDRLAAAERWVGAAASDEARAAAIAAGMVVRRFDVLHHLPSAIALYRAGLARLTGDLEGTIGHARTALATAGLDLPLERGGAAGLLALASWSQGDLDGAFDAWAEAAEQLTRADHHADVLGCTLGMADIRTAQGRLYEAARILEGGLHSAERSATPPRGIADMHVGLAELHVEWDDPAEARRQLARAAEVGEGMGLPQHPHRWRIATALACHAEGELDDAVDLLDAAERHYDGDFFPEVRPIAAIRARVWLAQGRIDAAQGWAREAAIGPDGEVTYLSEYALLTYARILLAEAAAGARESGPAAAALLERIAAAAEAGGRGRSHVEALALLAAVRASLGDGTGAGDALHRALRIAEPGGLVRTFLDAGLSVERLLRDAARGGPAAALAQRVLAARTGQVDERPAQRGLVEPLSARELDVLRLLASDLDGPAIAGELYISLNTMRTHTRNIFGKLQVNSRREAVRRASELGLIASGG
jgi:LuxR family maltose regulon positive regulatory protein